LPVDPLKSKVLGSVPGGVSRQVLAENHVTLKKSPRKVACSVRYSGLKFLRPVDTWGLLIIDFDRVPEGLGL
jgi:hypothetical protein